jgi:hypothetical protein
MDALDETKAELRSSRRLLWWSVGCLLSLIVLGVLCKFLAVPMLQTHAALKDFAAGRAGYRATVDRMGGECLAGGRLTLYLWLPRKLADQEVSAISVLGNMGPAAGDKTGLLVGLLRSSDDVQIRANAAWALGRMGALAVRTAPDLRGAALDKEPRVRAAAIAALARIEGEKSLPVIIAALKDGSAFVRHPAARLLAEMGLAARPAEKALEGALAAERRMPGEEPNPFTIEEALKRVRTPAPPISEQDAEVRWKLGRKMGFFDANNIPASKALEGIAAATEVEIENDKENTVTYLLGRSVTLRTTQMEAGKNLNWMLRLVGLDYEIRDGKVLVIQPRY